MSFQSLGHCCNRGEIEVLFNFVSTKLFILRYLYYINPSIILIKLSQKHLKLLPLQNINILLWEDPEGHLFRFFFQKISAALHAMKNILEDILSVSLRNALSCVLNLKKKKAIMYFHHSNTRLVWKESNQRRWTVTQDDSDLQVIIRDNDGLKYIWNHEKHFCTSHATKMRTEESKTIHRDFVKIAFILQRKHSYSL